MTGVKGVTEVHEGKKQSCHRGQGPIVEGLECHTDKFRHAPGDEAGQ